MTNGVSSGTLYIVSTPIGNLEDISFRALKVLAGVTLIAAEDTRTTGVLLRRYDIHTPVISYYSYNEERRTPELIRKLAAGISVALVTDAGTPGISDPAYRVIRTALDEGIAVVPVPGPSALLAALTVSGLSLEQFVFEGFLPVKKGRKKAIEDLKAPGITIVLFESPHRLLRTLKDLLESLGDRGATVARELTKKFEEVRRGTLSSHIRHFSASHPRGEFVLVVSGGGGPSGRGS